jgi:hypothetical protein
MPESGGVLNYRDVERWYQAIISCNPKALGKDKQGSPAVNADRLGGRITRLQPTFRWSTWVGFRSCVRPSFRPWLTARLTWMKASPLAGGGLASMAWGPSQNAPDDDLDDGNLVLPTT